MVQGSIEKTLNGLLEAEVDKQPTEMICTLVAYYTANRSENSEWVLLSVVNVDCWLRDTNFGQKYPSQILKETIQRISSFSNKPV